MANIDNYDWYSLIQISGAFISPKVFKEAFPQGLNWVDSHSRRALRNDYEDALDEIDRNPAEHKRIRRQWCESVFREFLGYDEGVMDLAAPPIPLSKEEGENRDFVLKSIETTDKFRPDYIIHKPGEPENVRYFVAIADNKDLNQSDNRRWPVTPLEQMTQLCRLYKVEIGMVTNGSQWALVYAPIDTTSSTIVWNANMWFQEPDTLRAFHTFWCAQTCCDEDRWPEKLIRASSEYNDNVTTQLGAQVRRAVEVLIQCLDKEDRNREGRLLNDIDPGTLYQAGLTVMMRLVFILCAEERGLLMLGDAVYDQFYAISTLRGQLEDDASKYGEDVLERRYDAWARMLAVFRAIYHGVEHENLRMPALGGSIFDPDAYPFLEGRAAGSKWLDGDDADPLPIDNHTVLLLLDALQILQHKDGARRLSYRALDVEQIGHVYEGLLEHTVERAKDVILGFEYTKGKDIHPDIALTELESARFDGEEKVKMLISECTGKKITDATWKKKFLVPDDDLSRQIVRICGSDDKMAKRILPYAGFLRKNAWGEPIIYHKGAYMVTSGSFRSDTGTYYTPKKLTELVVKDALEPVVYIGPAEGKPREEWQLKTPAELLSLSICDPAMGSGAFLVQVCRYLGERICEGWELAIEAGKAVTVDGEVLDELGDREPLPKSADERLTIARRLVAKHCIYGVDINPMAVELAKLSIWLVTMSKNKPFGYLDHCFKCGDSLLGIHSIEQLRHCAMNPDVTEPIQKVLFHKDISQNIEDVIKLQQEIRQTRVLDIQDVEAIRRKNDLSQRTMANLKLLADAFVAEAFRCADKPKTVKKALEAVMCLGSDIFNEKSLGHMPAVEQAKRIANVGVSIDANRPRKPMHWLLEFPQVMMHGGFDVIVGNPPFLGGQHISGQLGKQYRSFLETYTQYTKTQKGSADFVSYFINRSTYLIKNKSGIFGLIGSKTVAEGGTKEVGLSEVINRGFLIYNAFSGMKWPGTANVVVSIVFATGLAWNGNRYLNNCLTTEITSSLTIRNNWKPLALNANQGVVYQGVIVNNLDAFLIDDAEIEELEDRSKTIVYKFLTGRDVSSRPLQDNSRKILCFWDWSKIRAQQYIGAFDYLTDRINEHGDNYWQYGCIRKGLHQTIGRGDLFEEPMNNVKPKRLDSVIVISRVTKYCSFSFVDNIYVFDNSLCVVASESYGLLATLSSEIHNIWAWEYCSKMKHDMRYTHGTIFETFPFPHDVLENNNHVLNQLGECFCSLRKKYMLSLGVGLTSMYNDINNPDIETKDVGQLRKIIVNINEEIMNQYRFDDINLEMGFYKPEYRPNDWRFTMSESAREKVLARLCELNRERYEAEQRGSTR